VAFDHLAQDDVTGVGVRPALARLARRPGAFHPERDLFVSLPAALQVGRDGCAIGRQLAVVWQATGVGQQLAQRDARGIVTASAQRGFGRWRDQPGQRSIEADPVFSDEPQHGGADEELGDAGNPERPVDQRP